jgi:NADH dehydrogenase FAD-containing subunit
LLQRGERILPEVTASLAAFAHKLLVKRGIEIRISNANDFLSVAATLR